MTGDLFPVSTVEESRRIVLRGTEIAYHLKRSARRQRIAFLVDERGLTVHVPWQTPFDRIEHAIASADRWILTKVREWAARPAAPARRWSTGEPIEYLGRALVLNIVEDPIAVTVELRDPNTLEVRAPGPITEDRTRDLIVRWYRRHALRHFAERLSHFSAHLGVDRPRLLLSDAGSRWGSCNSRGQVRLNWRLMQAREPLVDYVVAHEVAHLLHLNHSRRFWKAVEKIYPGYEAARTELAGTTRHLMSL